MAYFLPCGTVANGQILKKYQAIWSHCSLRTFLRLMVIIFIWVNFDRPNTKVGIFRIRTHNLSHCIQWSLTTFLSKTSLCLMRHFKSKVHLPKDSYQLTYCVKEFLACFLTLFFWCLGCFCLFQLVWFIRLLEATSAAAVAASESFSGSNWWKQLQSGINTIKLFLP